MEPHREQAHGQLSPDLIDPSIGNRAVAYAIRAVSVGCASAALFFSSTFIADAFSHDSLSDAPVPTFVGDAHQPLDGASEAHDQPSHHSSDKLAKQPLCVRIAMKAGGFYMGEACAYDTKNVEVIGVSKSGKYDYVELEVGDSDKCGWILGGALPSKENRNPDNPCIKYENELTENPEIVLEDPNCKIHSCKDGEPDDPETEQCDDDFFANFSPSTPSPLNLFPNSSNTGFKQFMGKQYDPVHYRFTVKFNSPFGRAINVRSDTYDWGYEEKKCVSQRAIESEYGEQ